MIAAAASIPCTGNGQCGLVAQADKARCCEPTPPAKCDTLDTAAVTSMCTGASYTGVLITDAASTSCSGLTCVADDAATCCHPTAKCDTFDANVCTGDDHTGFLKATASTDSCAGETCDGDDATTCCEPKAQCGSIIVLNDICSGADFTGNFITERETTNCVGRVCGPVDEPTCCELKDKCDSLDQTACGQSFHIGTLIGAAATTNCAGATCDNSDAATCCLHKATCATFDGTGCTGGSYTGEFIADSATTYCTGVTCDNSDASTCCELEAAKCTSLTGSSDPTLASVCVSPNYEPGALIAAAATTSCAGVTCGSVDANTCCRSILTVDDIARLKELLGTIAQSDTEQQERLTVHYNVLATETL